MALANALEGRPTAVSHALAPLLPEQEPDLWHLTKKQLAEATSGFAHANLLGRGGFGEVFKGQLHGTTVAIKRFFTGGSVPEFLREVEILNQLRHPNIVLLMGCSPDCLCMVSEYMAGGSLYDRLSATPSKIIPPLSWLDRFHIASEMSSALLYMHSRRVLHRDLKPANVLLDSVSQPRAKLCDMVSSLADLLPPLIVTGGARFVVTNYHGCG